MEFAPWLTSEVKDYIGRLSVHSDPVLRDMETLAEERQFPIIGPVVGRFLFQLAFIKEVRRIFELGSGYGYSTLWFAQALKHLGRGEIFHTDTDRENSEQARRYLSRAGVEKFVRFIVGDAVQSLRSTPGLFDLIYMDINKDQYPDAFPIIREKLGRGGVLIVDNMLWFGRVLAGDSDSWTEGIRRFTTALWGDAEFFSTLVPLRDGFSISVRVRC